MVLGNRYEGVKKLDCLAWAGCLKAILENQDLSMLTVREQLDRYQDICITAHLLPFVKF